MPAARWLIAGVFAYLCASRLYDFAREGAGLDGPEGVAGLVGFAIAILLFATLGFRATLATPARRYFASEPIEPPT